MAKGSSHNHSKATSEGKRVTAEVRNGMLSAMDRFEGSYFEKHGEDVLEVKVSGRAGFWDKFIREQPKEFVGALSRMVPREVIERISGRIEHGLIAPDEIESMRRAVAEERQLVLVRDAELVEG